MESANNTNQYSYFSPSRDALKSRAHEGAILSMVTRMIKKKQTSVETILIEMGEGVASWHCGDDNVHGSPKGACPHHSTTVKPRGGDIRDVHLLQHKFGYDLYRINIHVDREMYDWKGVNMNENMAPERSGVTSMFGVRNMRKLEKVHPTNDIGYLGSLFRFGTSFLLTRVQLADIATHHKLDLDMAKITEGMDALNKGNPAFGNGR